jgi:hypothetical protein
MIDMDPMSPHVSRNFKMLSWALVIKNILYSMEEFQHITPVGLKGSKCLFMKMKSSRDNLA